jgi:aryl-alcohol dehydrogenase-like predicted oxidoreductase
MSTRLLGKSGISVSAMGLGCWAIGGPAWRDDSPIGWGEVDDGASIRAIQRALEMGVTFFDTANVYGAGHSERIVGQALAGVRDQVVIATKFGNMFDEGTRRVTGASGESKDIVRACEESLRRLRTDRIDLYQFHLGDYDPQRAPDVMETLEGLVSDGKIRWYGWSTDDPDRAAIFAPGEHCTAIQFRLNLVDRNDRMVELCREHNLAAVNKGPLAMGLLTGKFSHSSQIPADDVRHRWDLAAGRQAEQLDLLERLRDVLTRDGRSLAQAALGWIWASNERSIPIPGFKTVEQVEDNAGAMVRGPLTPDQTAEIQRLLQGQAQGEP